MRSWISCGIILEIFFFAIASLSLISLFSCVVVWRKSQGSKFLAERAGRIVDPGIVFRTVYSEDRIPYQQ